MGATLSRDARTGCCETEGAPFSHKRKVSVTTPSDIPEYYETDPLLISVTIPSEIPDYEGPRSRSHYEGPRSRSHSNDYSSIPATNDYPSNPDQTQYQLLPLNKLTKEYDDPLSGSHYDKPRSRFHYDKPRSRFLSYFYRLVFGYDKPRSRSPTNDNSSNPVSHDYPSVSVSHDYPSVSVSHDYPSVSDYDEPRSRSSSNDYSSNPDYDEPCSRSSSNDYSSNPGAELPSTLKKTQSFQPLDNEQSLADDKAIGGTIEHSAEQDRAVDRAEKVHTDTSVWLSLDFAQHLITNNIDTDDATYGDEQFLFGAGVSNCLEASSSISKEGGNIEIPKTGVELQIQPNSMLRDDEVHLITVKILPHRIFDKPASCFEDHTTVMVEILPNNLQLQRPAKLKLPHCLILRHLENSQVQIFHSHHEQDQSPHWENISQSVRCELLEASCSIWISYFSWIKCEIGGRYIEGKKLFVYTLGEKFSKESNNVTAEVGYFPALPGNDRIERDVDLSNSVKGTVYESKLPEMFRGTWQLIVFRKEPQNSLQISISEIIPPGGWEASSGSACKEISYQNIEMSIEQSCPFTFQRKNAESSFPVVHFKIFQGHESSPTELYVNMEKGLIKEESEVASCAQPRSFVGLSERHMKIMTPIYTNEYDMVDMDDTALVLSNSCVTERQRRRQQQHQLQTLASEEGRLESHLMTWNPFHGSVAPITMPYSQTSLKIFQDFTRSEIVHVADCLNTVDPLHRDWKMLAEQLTFSCDDIAKFEKQPSPTEAVIRSACNSGNLTGKSHLKDILKKMERRDALMVFECKAEYSTGDKDNEEKYRQRPLMSGTYKA